MKRVWWHLVRLQPLGSDGSWKFRHPYLFVMIMLASIPIACIIVNVVTPDQGTPWWITVGLCLLWVALTIGADHLDGRLMKDAGPLGEYPGDLSDLDNG